MTKINQLIKNWRKGTIKTVKELFGLGYTPQLLKIYTRSKWINLIERGAYKLYDDKVGWEGGLYCLQKGKSNTIHAGGKTALELKGYAHYLSQKETTVELFGNKQDMLPTWFKKQDWMQFLMYNVTNVFNYNSMDHFTKIDVNNVPITISVPELAVMEMLYLVPKAHSFEEADLIIQSLTTLRSKVVQELLERCASIKIKRMFLYLSEKNEHIWFDDLKLDKVNLGSGKREIVKKGMLDKKYKITVPKGKNFEG